MKAPIIVVLMISVVRCSVIRNVPLQRVREPRGWGDVPLVVVGNYQSGSNLQSGSGNTQSIVTTTRIHGNNNAVSSNSIGSTVASLVPTNPNPQRPPHDDDEQDQTQLEDAVQAAILQLQTALARSRRHRSEARPRSKSEHRMQRLRTVD